MINFFFIINYNNQKQIDIHYVGCTFCCLIKPIKFCYFCKFLFYDLLFEFSALNGSNIYYSTIRLFIRYDLLSQEHFSSLLFALFIVSELLSIKSEYIFGFNPTNSLIAISAISSLSESSQ